MKLKFDPNQQYRIDVIQYVVDIFEGNDQLKTKHPASDEGCWNWDEGGIKAMKTYEQIQNTDGIRIKGNLKNEA